MSDQLLHNLMLSDLKVKHIYILLKVKEHIHILNMYKHKLVQNNLYQIYLLAKSKHQNYQHQYFLNLFFCPKL